MVIARHEIAQDSVSQPIRIPKIRLDENGRVMLSQLSIGALEYVGTPLVAYAVLQELQRSSRHTQLDRELWNLLAAYYSSSLTTNAPELKRFASMKVSTSGSVVRRHIQNGMKAAFDGLSVDAKTLFSPEERKHITALKDRHAPVYEVSQRKAVQSTNFRARQRELRLMEDSTCLRRQKLREMNKEMAINEVFQQYRRQRIRAALKDPSVREKISTALERQWQEGIRRGITKAEKMRRLRYQQVESLFKNGGGFIVMSDRMLTLDTIQPRSIDTDTNYYEQFEENYSDIKFPPVMYIKSKETRDGKTLGVILVARDFLQQVEKMRDKRSFHLLLKACNLFLGEQNIVYPKKLEKAEDILERLV